MTFIVKPIAASDLAFVSRIMQHRWHVSQKWADREVKKFLAQNHEAAGFVIHTDNQPIGVGLFDKNNPDVSTHYKPWFYLLWVEPDYRGHNLGALLTQARIEHAKKHGYTHVFLDTRDAYDYHIKHGWRVVETVIFENAPTTIMSYDLAIPFVSRPPVIE